MSKWFARARRNHHKRLAVLVDAKAIIGAVAKGRTNAPGLRGVVRALGAYQMASDVLLRLIYIPTDHNPADLPSRGTRCRFRSRRKAPTPSSRFGTKTERLMEKHLLDLAKVRLW